MSHVRLTVGLITLGVGLALLIAIFLGPRLRERFNTPPAEEPAEGSESASTDDNPAEREEPEDSGKDLRSLGYLVAPIITLTVLMLSFTLVQTWTAFRDAIASVGRESRTVDYMADASASLPEPHASRLRGATVCYARAVVNEEWPALADNKELAVPDVDRWTDELESGLTALAASTATKNPFAREIITADRERAQYRGQRLAEVRASIPIPITLFLLGATMLAIIGLGIAYMAADTRVLHVAFLGVLSLLFAGVLYIVTELDTPYSGLIELMPTDMERVARLEAASFAQDLPGQVLPCDELGRPLTP